MSLTKIAKLFKNGSSQAVRLPAEFRFDGTLVYATRDDLTGDVVLSDRPGAIAWRDFFETVHSIKAAGKFMTSRPMNVPPRERRLFSEKD